ncbi:MAG TPA: NAD(P)/FAD-dependent oxidoreductase [Chloroflexota bacterium]|nr:NAD(P)/FAD-dependent oxidoreductase [Chloroflexota bacterium]
MSSGNEPEVYDITIIGAGPVGLYGLYYTSMRGMRAKVVDSLPQVGGQLMALYPEKYIYDVPGFRKVLAKDLIHNLEDQAFQHNPTVCVNERIATLTRGEDGIITLVGESGNVHLSRTVLIAAGVGAFVPRKLDVPKLDVLEGRGVHYFVKNMADFKDKRVLIVGGGDSAVDWAMALEPIAKQIMLIHKFEQFQAHEKSVEDLRGTSTIIKVPYELKTIHGEEHVEGVTIFQNKTGVEEEHDVDALFMNIGFVTNLGPIKSWGLEISKNSVLVTAQMATNIPGVYAAGDICTHPGHLKLISVGAGEAAVAVNNAKSFIDPTARVEPGHSSHKKQE